MADHFTAVVRITKTVEPKADTAARGYTSPEPKGDRKVHSIADITVRAATVEGLRDKLAAHIAIVDDDALGSAHG